jgi:hypothetical protein
MGISFTPISPADRGMNWIFLWGEETSWSESSIKITCRFAFQSHARTWRSGTRSSLGFPVPIELIAIKVIAVNPYLNIITFWILFSKSRNIFILVHIMA